MPWTPQGVGDYQPYVFDADSREHIVQELKHHDVAVDDHESLFGALGHAVANYRAYRQLREASKPASVRENLGLALEAAEELQARIHALDGNSRSLLTEVMKGSSRALLDEAMEDSALAESDMHGLEEHTDRIANSLRLAYALAQQYPKRGSLPEPERLKLAVDVADIFADKFQQEPTTTRAGAYESLLMLVLEEASGREVNEAHQLARRALEARKAAQ